MINITNLSKHYGKHKVVDGLSLTIDTGTIFGFLGPNGAGKTTTMKMLVGLSRPDAGTITIGKNNITEITAKSQIGYMPEDPYFYDHLHALEFLEFMNELFPKNLRHSNQDLTQTLKLVGLDSARNKKIKHFSKGMKQRLGLAQSLVNDPGYIFLDEPLDGLDPIGRREFKEIILGLKKRGKTVFFNSHILSDVEELCDAIGIIHHGHLIYEGPVKQFMKGKPLETRFVETITNA
ncbi:MAG: putative ABC transporter ATP-binding protein YxlF [bacterium ADurb.Bin400]|nr:MAG: putative ABC transporter ATP-binding protein YxlF [bacterium ADurb.Bin400]